MGALPKFFNAKAQSCKGRKENQFVGVLMILASCVICSGNRVLVNVLY